MSLEGAVLRMARAIETSQEGTAVREIIRQRDQALKSLEHVTADRDYEHQQRAKYWAALETECRRVRALKAYIRRLKAGPK